jgi:hypothetical protein
LPAPPSTEDACPARRADQDLAIAHRCGEGTPVRAVWPEVSDGWNIVAHSALCAENGWESIASSEVSGRYCTIAGYAAFTAAVRGAGCSHSTAPVAKARSARDG